MHATLMAGFSMTQICAEQRKSSIKAIKTPILFASHRLTEAFSSRQDISYSISLLKFNTETQVPSRHD